ncbi:hypothetical protein SCA6_005127 [Theobroma cacao]
MPLAVRTINPRGFFHSDYGSFYASCHSCVAQGFPNWCTQPCRAHTMHPVVVACLTEPSPLLWKALAVTLMMLHVFESIEDHLCPHHVLCHGHQYWEGGGRYIPCHDL